jgi:hypothetical protein
MNVAFKYCLSGQVHPIAKAYPVTNGVVYKKGDFVMLTAGLAVLATATNPILGSVEGVISATKAPVGADAGYTDQWTGVTGQFVLVNVDPTAVYAVDLSAALHTTGAAHEGVHFDITDKDTVDESSATTSAAQLTLVSGAADATRADFVIYERMLV